MRLAIILLASLPALAQIRVQAQPTSLAAGAAAIGPGREAGAWKIMACNAYPTAKAFDSTMLLMALPDLPVLDQQESDALLDQRTKRSGWARIARGIHVASTVIIPIVGAAIAFTGTNSNATSVLKSIRITNGVQGGVAVLELLGKDAETRAPTYQNRTPLEPVIALSAAGQPGSCIQRKVLASLVRGAKTMTATFELP